MHIHNDPFGRFLKPVGGLVTAPPSTPHLSSPTAGGSPLEEEAIVKATRKKQHRAAPNKTSRKATVNDALAMGRTGCPRTDRMCLANDRVVDG